MVAPTKQWEVSLVYSCFQIPQDLEGTAFLTVKYLNLMLFILSWSVGPSLYPVHFQDTKQFVSAKDVLKKEPVSDVIALKESMKYFDADFFNDSKVYMDYFFISFT
jgi:hypothetical protein